MRCIVANVFVRVGFCVALVSAGCSTKTVSVPSRNGTDAGVDDPSTADQDGGAQDPAGQQPPGARDGVVVGVSCVDDDQCDDGFDCTFDDCDQRLSRCVHAADHSKCDDGVYCNGVELCDPAAGCRQGDPTSCTDRLPCTIDVCLEETRSCSHELRDADADGVPDWLCEADGDCDDADPRVSPNADEICGNQRDDDCDGATDERDDCVTPEWDTCDTALVVEASGSYSLRVGAATLDDPAPCLSARDNLRDVVVELRFPDSGVTAADIVMTTAVGTLVSVGSDACEDLAGVTCIASMPLLDGGSLGRTLVPGAPGETRWFHLYTDGTADIELSVDLVDRAELAHNDACEDATLLLPGEHARAYVPVATQDADTACPRSGGELFFEIEVAETSDLEVFAQSVDALGVPSLSLRSACDEELVCVTHEDARLFARALSAGRYLLAVSALGPTEVDVTAVLSEPTPAPPGDTCVESELLEPGSPAPIELDKLANSIDVGCLPGAVDAARRVDVAERSDLLFIERFTAGDAVSLAVSDAECRAALLDRCVTADSSPLRLALHDLAPGDYQAVVESRNANPVTLDVLQRPATAPTLVPLSRDCASATPIPTSGGFFQGNTANALPLEELSCDIAGLANAPEQLLTLQLEEPTRVVLDMQGSAYQTALVIREATEDGCLGDEVRGACSAGYDAPRSFLDVLLEPGAYFIQVDGYGGESGRWFLDVFLQDAP